MASWELLGRHVRQKYDVEEETDDELRILYEFDDERTQFLVLRHEPMRNGDDWVQIVSPCGSVGVVDLGRLLTEVGENTVVGGVVVIDGTVLIRHSLPLANLDFNEFDEPLELVAMTADDVENTFFGGDRF